MEIEDAPWLPAAVRNSMTAVLDAAITRLGIYDPVVPLFTAPLKNKSTAIIVDLCSGGGGGYTRLKPAIEKATGTTLRVVLTDRYPNRQKLLQLKEEPEGKIIYLAKSMDAKEGVNLPADMLTLFAGFHHFDESYAARFFQTVQKTKKPLLIVEGAKGNFTTWLMALFVLPLLTWAVTPFCRPLPISQLLLTYFIPVIPVLVWWDGLMSLAAIRDAQEIAEEAARHAPDYLWRYGELPGPFGLKIQWVYGSSS